MKLVALHRVFKQTGSLTLLTRYSQLAPRAQKLTLSPHYSTSVCLRGFSFLVYGGSFLVPLSPSLCLQHTRLLVTHTPPSTSDNAPTPLPSPKSDARILALNRKAFSQLLATLSDGQENASRAYSNMAEVLHLTAEVKQGTISTGLRKKVVSRLTELLRTGHHMTIEELKAIMHGFVRLRVLDGNLCSLLGREARHHLLFLSTSDILRLLSFFGSLHMNDESLVSNALHVLSRSNKDLGFVESAEIIRDLAKLNHPQTSSYVNAFLRRHRNDPTPTEVNTDLIIAHTSVLWAMAVVLEDVDLQAAKRFWLSSMTMVRKHRSSTNTGIMVQLHQAYLALKLAFPDIAQVIYYDQGNEEVLGACAEAVLKNYNPKLPEKSFPKLPEKSFFHHKRVDVNGMLRELGYSVGNAYKTPDVGYVCAGQIAGTNVVIELDTPSNYGRVDTGRALGSYVLKLKLLRGAGYDVREFMVSVMVKMEDKDSLLRYCRAVMEGCEPFARAGSLDMF